MLNITIKLFSIHACHGERDYMWLKSFFKQLDITTKCMCSIYMLLKGNNSKIHKNKNARMNYAHAKHNNTFYKK